MRLHPVCNTAVSFSSEARSFVGRHGPRSFFGPIRALFLAPLLAGVFSLCPLTGRLIAQEAAADQMPPTTPPAASAPEKDATGQVCVKDEHIDRLVLTTKESSSRIRIGVTAGQPVSVPAGEYVPRDIHLREGFTNVWGWLHFSGPDLATQDASQETLTVLPGQLLTLDASSLHMSLPLRRSVQVHRQGAKLTFSPTILDGDGHLYYEDQGKPRQLAIFCDGQQVGEGSPRYG